MNHAEHQCLVIDNGLFVSLAETLGRSFGKVWYFSEFAGEFPKDSETAIGHGLPGVQRIYDYWSVLDKADRANLLVVFPDSYYGGLQEHLRELGFRVWGSGRGEDLELDRLKAKRAMEKLGIPVGPYEHIKGFDSLRSQLKARTEDCFVKARYGRIRGNFETFRSEGYDLVKSRLDEIEANLGTRASATEFLIEDAIAPAVEVGYDGYCIFGQFPNAATVGIEVKGDGYVGRFIPVEKQPPQITGINELFGPSLGDYANFFAVEARIDREGTPWAIDPCLRCGRPPSELLQLMYTNLPDILWHGAQGTCIDPEPAAEWGAELMIYCERAERYGCTLDYPDDIAPYVKLADACIVNGQRVVVPGIAGIGAVVAVGDTMEAAMKLCVERAKKVKGFGIEIAFEAFDKAKEAFEELKGYGVDLLA